MEKVNVKLKIVKKVGTLTEIPDDTELTNTNQKKVIDSYKLEIAFDKAKQLNSFCQEIGLTDNVKKGKTLELGINFESRKVEFGDNDINKAKNEVEENFKFIFGKNTSNADELLKKDDEEIEDDDNEIKTLKKDENGKSPLNTDKEAKYDIKESLKKLRLYNAWDLFETKILAVFKTNHFELKPKLCTSSLVSTVGALFMILFDLFGTQQITLAYTIGMVTLAFIAVFLDIAAFRSVYKHSLYYNALRFLKKKVFTRKGIENQLSNVKGQMSALQIDDSQCCLAPICDPVYPKNQSDIQETVKEIENLMKNTQKQ